MIRTGKDLVRMVHVVLGHKTLYVMGCFGAPMTSGNKDRYTHNDPYNMRPSRRGQILSADEDTFGFDCVGLIKGLLWGWCGKVPSIYGGADYCQNGVPDLDANAMLDVCEGISTDFSQIQPGEALGIRDHIGIYLGNGLAAEATPRWEDGVQITAVHNLGVKKGYEGRTWTRHGKLPWIAYDPIYKPFPEVRPNVPDKEDFNMAYTRDNFVRDIQNVTGSKVDGVAGPQTLENTPNLSSLRNTHHMAVLPVQKRLAALGYVVGPKGDDQDLDGQAGVWFSKAVKAFQRDQGLMDNPDGELTGGCKSWKRLLEV